MTEKEDSPDDRYTAVYSEPAISFKDLVENLPVGIISFDLDGHFLYLSPLAMKMLRADEEIITNKRIFDFLDGQWLQIYFDRVKLYAKGIHLPKQEYQINRVDGSSFWAEINSFVQKDRDGNVKSINIIMHDISDRKTFVSDLNEQEQKFKHVFENAGFPMALCNHDGKPFLCNPAFTKFIGYSESELALMHFADYSHDDELANEMQLFDSLMAGKIDRYQQEKRYICKGGQTKWGYLTATSVKDSDGIPIYCVRILEDITEIKLARESILRSETKYKSLFNNMTSGFALFDLLYDDGVLQSAIYEEVNPMFERITGFPAAKVMGRSANEIFGDEFCRPLFEIFHSVNSTGQPTKFQRYDRLLNIYLNFRVFKYDQNKIAILFADITARIMAEQAIKESELKYRTLFENMTSGFILFECIKDDTGRVIDFRYVDVNPAFERITGLPASRVIGKSGREVFGDEFLNDSFPYYKNVLETGQAVTYQRFSSRLQQYFESLVFRQGETKIAAIFLDITDRKKAELALQASENQYRSLFENMNTGYCLLRPARNDNHEITDYFIIDVNPAFQTNTGLAPEAVLNRKVGDFITVEPEWIALYPEIINANSQKFMELFLPELNRHFFVWVFTPGDGLIAIMILDFTERVRIQKELELHKMHLQKLVEERTAKLADLNKLLQAQIVKQSELTETVRVALEREKELSDLKSRFISMASHEFRTPLTTIHSSAQLLEKYGREWSDEMYFKQLNRIKEYVHHLTDVMDDVLVISRTETGKLKYEPRKTDLVSLCGTIIDSLKGMLSDSHVMNFSMKLRRKYFQLDEKLMKNILLNLLSNAIKYSPGGGEIGFTVFKEGQDIVFKITDQGIGISENDQHILFEPFHRGANVGDIKGTGLGMSIVKRCVSMHNGRIKFFSNTVSGSQFFVYIPVE